MYDRLAPTFGRLHTKTIPSTRGSKIRMRLDVGVGQSVRLAHLVTHYKATTRPTKAVGDLSKLPVFEWKLKGLSTIPPKEIVVTLLQNGCGEY